MAAPSFCAGLQKCLLTLVVVGGAVSQLTAAAGTV